MNLNALVGPIVAAITPQVTLTIAQSTGYTTNAAGQRTPTYANVTLQANVQPVSAGDLRLMASLNIQGEARRVYANGTYNGVVRAAQKGGDLITDSASRVWKITEVAEYWDDFVTPANAWCSFVMTLQNGS